MSIEIRQVCEGNRITYRTQAYRERTVTVDRVWHVYNDGEYVGRFAYKMLTRERRTPGRMYVNKRWQSPGWVYEGVWRDERGMLRNGEPVIPTPYFTGSEAYSRKDAIERITRKIT